MKNRLTTILVLAGLIQLVGSLLYFKIAPDSTFATLSYTLTKILILITPIFVLKYGPKITKWNPTTPKSGQIALGLITGVATFLFIYLAHPLIIPDPQALKPLVTTKLTSLGILNYFIPFAIFLSLAHSLIEEYFWRWFIFRGLTVNHTFWPAALISSALFTLHHIVILSTILAIGPTILGTLAVFTGGLIWCYLYRYTKSLLTPWIAHAFADAAIMLIIYTQILT